MALKFFHVPCRGGASEEAELNRFLGGHRVLAVDRELAPDGAASYWALCVDFLETGTEAVVPGGSKIDYKEILPPEQFTVFARLRQLRKDLAEKEGVPVYAVFTNEQLAGMVRQPCKTAADLRKIEGIGDARVEKYGAAMLAALAAPAP